MASHPHFPTMVALLILGTLASQAIARTVPEPSMIERHEQWMVRYGRTYKDNMEKEMRFQIFKENVELIESFNRDSSRSYRLGVNGFADQTNEEFRAGHNGYKMSGLSSSATAFKYENLTAVPASIDWRTKGAVTPVKNQGQCGSCWAFSAVGSMEGVNQLTTGKLISLSEQELVDCDTSGEDQGCNGGEMDEAFKYIIANNGLTTESNYPYTGTDGTCDKQKTTPAAKITGFQNVPVNNEDALMKAVASQPVSVAIDASGFAFQFYSGGVFTGDCGTDLDHGVTAVGYGTSDDGTKYWLIKNSWGADWGEAGYIRMEKDISAKQGLCGIAMDASYPTA